MQLSSVDVDESSDVNVAMFWLGIQCFELCFLGLAWPSKPQLRLGVAISKFKLPMRKWTALHLCTKNINNIRNISPFLAVFPSSRTFYVPFDRHKIYT